jgi:hypothetical protein
MNAHNYAEFLRSAWSPQRRTKANQGAKTLFLSFCILHFAFPVRFRVLPLAEGEQRVPNG